MNRPVALVAVMLLTALGDFVASPPAAEAVGVGVCTISGTIEFTPSAAAEHGSWVIGPATIACRGPFRFPHPEQMNGVAGSFSGIGSYTTGPAGPGHCFRQLGSGTVDYWIKTEEQDVHVKEPHEFVLGGAGLFTTPTLRGPFEVGLQDGNCLAAPVNRATFLAQVSVLRVPPPEYLGPD